MMTEEEREEQRRIDDDYNVVNHYYRAKMMHPNIPFYLQDEMGNTYEFKWELIYQYIHKLMDTIINVIRKSIMVK